MLKPVSILLLFSLLFANCSNLIVFAGFELNKKFIATTLCVNINKPELQCNGKCYLIQKLKQAQEKEQKQEQQSQKPQLQAALVEIPLLFSERSYFEVKLHIPFSTGMPQSIKNSIFHPPQSFWI
ncbi:MAG: hypothetical protein EOO92_04775 [Pedobacter sp.]|nr:MAG: hypothetical protein EOO92_04775 [Pedobacter sp.]